MLALVAALLSSPGPTCPLNYRDHSNSLLAADAADTEAVGGLAHVVQLETAVALDHQVNQASVVMFHTPGCTHCQRFRPVFLELAKKMTEERSGVHFVMVNMKEARDVSRLYNIRGVPTVRYYAAGVGSEYDRDDNGADAFEAFVRREHEARGSTAAKQGQGQEIAVRTPAWSHTRKLEQEQPALPKRCESACEYTVCPENQNPTPSALPGGDCQCDCVVDTAKVAELQADAARARCDTVCEKSSCPQGWKAQASQDCETCGCVRDGQAEMEISKAKCDSVCERAVCPPGLMLHASPDCTKCQCVEPASLEPRSQQQQAGGIRWTFKAVPAAAASRS